ncbi:hypothetical protein [Brumimicrobium aurantiacum]|uniref:DUF3575 domain-containing protein n=1 Tax=Brumimicrobium aurantiacum TaxID=1737063 RepID=A0A3E1EUS6_9FLAO|nr:hypothetical protein [Brumimicrobium aurantiacum]RFC53307.1 hypothetical protein DXU93_13980 [Brumimicrobium aurantiacum]
MKRLLLLFLVFSSIDVSSQIKVVDLEDEKEGQSPYFNTLKVKPFDAIISDFPIVYERAFSKRFALVGSLGLTNLLSVLMSTTDYVGRNDKLGYSLAFGPKIYFKEKFDGLYLETLLKYRHHRSIYLNDEGEIFKGKTSHLLPRISMGYSFIIFKRGILDLSLGYGTSIADEHSYNSYKKEYENKNISKTHVIHIGIKGGFLF